MVRAVLLDAFGTLVGFGDPVPALRAELAARTGAHVGEEDARRALRAEVAYYRAHHDEAPDLAALARLRHRCGEIVRDELALGGPAGPVADALVAAIRFHAYPEVPGVLAALRARGLRLAVVSNWDVSLRTVLDELGLLGLVDAVVISAEQGVAKPEPAIFATALEQLGVAAGDAVHVGDSVAHDVVGAGAAGIAAVLVHRGEEPAPPLRARVRVIATLDGLLDVVPLRAGAP